MVALATVRGQVLLDESRATRVAEALGFRPLSTLFLPLLGRSSGVLTEAHALEFLRRLSIATGARADVVIRIEAILRGMTP